MDQAEAHRDDIFCKKDIALADDTNVDKIIAFDRLGCLQAGLFQEVCNALALEILRKAGINMWCLESTYLVLRFFKNFYSSTMITSDLELASRIQACSNAELYLAMCIVADCVAMKGPTCYTAQRLIDQQPSLSMRLLWIKALNMTKSFAPVFRTVTTDNMGVASRILHPWLWMRTPWRRLHLHALIYKAFAKSWDYDHYQIMIHKTPNSFWKWLDFGCPHFTQVMNIATGGRTLPRHAQWTFVRWRTFLPRFSMRMEMDIATGGRTLPRRAQWTFVRWRTFLPRISMGTMQRRTRL
jgi:hypothetical protein